MPRSPLAGQKTFWHLMGLKRMPTEYEIVSTRLLYYVEQGFEVDVPVRSWYERHQKGSPLVCSDWERFRDPRETTYASYTQHQNRREILLDDLLEAIEESGHDARVDPGWLGVLDRVLAPMRYPLHGFQMIASYVGQMAPGGRIAIAALLQAADEIRRVQRIAYRMRLLQLAHPRFGEGSRSTWETDPLWQPLRRAIEALLVTYDWGESLVGLDLVVKPVIDQLFVSEFARLAESREDPALARMLRFLGEDCAWHRAWSRELVRTALEDAPKNRDVVERWTDRWEPTALQAAAGFREIFGEAFAGVEVSLRNGLDEHLEGAGLVRGEKRRKGSPDAP